MSIGKSVPRSDAVAKVSGRARYTADFSMPGMLHAVYVRSTIAHGLVTHIDTKEAQKLIGVEAIFTAKDVPTRLFSSAGHPYALNRAEADLEDRLLLTSHVRYQGDEVAIVVARDELTARQAAALVRVEYEALPVLTGAEAALASEAPVLHLARGAAGNLVGEHTQCSVSPEEMDEVLTKAPHKAKGQYHTPMVQHCHMENQVAYAYMDDFERIVVVSSTQIPHICRRIVGEALEIPWSRVRVIKPFIGGGFGNKQDVILEPMVAYLTTRMGGRAVQIDLSREECLQCTRVRHPFRLDVQVVGDAEGKVQGIDIDALSNTGAYASHGHGIAKAGGGKIASMYPHAAYRFHARTVYTNVPTGGAMRGYGSPQVAFGLECALDDLALSMGLDPLEIRLRNAGKPGEVSQLNHKTFYTHGLLECLQQGAKAFGWAEARKNAVQQGNIRSGVGVACFSYGSGTYPGNVEPAGARLVLNQDGTFYLSCGASEIGQGADTVFSQMAAETLGVDVALVRTLSTQDTDFSPYDPGAYASRQTFVNGHAVWQCAEEMRRKILEQASLFTGHAVEYLSLEGAYVVFAHQPEHKLLSLAELALKAFYDKDKGHQVSAEASVKVRANPPAFGCTFTEVEVDIALCRLNIKRILNVHDSGIIINPALAMGQVQGGVGMGIGWALYEEMLIDAQSGKVHNANLLDYKMPTAADFPDIQTLFVESAEPTSAYGNKALGEPPLISPAPALRNALLHATGVAVNTLPLTPKNLFVHFQAAGLI